MEEVFETVAPIINVHVGGQIIRTTREHPFYVAGRGWIAAAFLETGDLLSTRDGGLVAVEGVADSGQVTMVYNWRVADYHTYFVGSKAWAFSVWAHNDCHHPILRALGGFRSQIFSVLARPMHQAFHIALNAAVKAKGLLPLFGRNGSRVKWFRFMRANPGAQRQAFDSILDVARDFDRRNGTNLVQDFWRNIMNGNFIPFP